MRSSCLITDTLSLIDTLLATIVQVARLVHPKASTLRIRMATKLQLIKAITVISVIKQVTTRRTLIAAIRNHPKTQGNDLDRRLI
jgi:hypothetical protein